MTTAIKAKIDSLIGIHSRDGYYTAALLTPDDLAEIKDQIAAVEAENARLKTLLSEWQGSHGAVEKHLEEIAAENARLREGLKMIADGCPQPRLTARGVLFHEECRAARAPHSADA